MPKVSFVSTLVKFLKKWFQSARHIWLVVLLVGIMAIVFGFSSITRSITSPFILDDVQVSQNTEQVEDGFSDIAALQTKDTDGDGLSDYAELYLYNTSPYLEDSDSDGYSDQTEINNGHNPTCPTGQNCFNDIGGSDSGDLDGGIVFEELNPARFSNEELRGMLVDYGLDPEILEKFDDETLRQMFNQAMSEVQVEQAEQGKQQVPSQVPNQEVNQDQILTDLKKLSADEIRQLLIESGAPEDQLDALSDEELVKLYEDIIAEEFKQ